MLSNIVGDGNWLLYTNVLKHPAHDLSGRTIKTPLYADTW